MTPQILIDDDRVKWNDNHEFFSLPKLYMVIIPCTLLDSFSFLHMKIASNFWSLHYFLI